MFNCDTHTRSHTSTVYGSVLKWWQVEWTFLSNSERRRHWRHLTDIVTPWLFGSICTHAHVLPPSHTHKLLHTHTHTHVGWLIGLLLSSTDITVCFGTSGAVCVCAWICVCERVHVCIKPTACVYSHFNKNVKMGWCHLRDDHFNQINGQADRRDMAARNREKMRLWKVFSSHLFILCVHQLRKIK